MHDPLVGYLAQYAHQLLDELCEEARAVDSRITALTGRTKTLVEYMDSIAPPTAFAGGATHRSIASVGPLPEAEPLLVEKQVNGLFTRESQPLAVRNRYRSPAVAEMPELHKIDALLQANNVPQTGPCAVQYSYPGGLRQPSLAGRCWRDGHTCMHAWITYRAGRPACRIYGALLHFHDHHQSFSSTSG